MRKSPDGKREVIEMLVPTEGSISKTIRFSGLGLPDKIVVAGRDADPTALFEILNRNTGQLTYETYQVIRGGMVPLDKKPIQDDDQTFAARSGGTFGHGISTEANLQPGVLKVIEPGDSPGPTASWIITTEKQIMLLVAPEAMDSFDLAEAMQKHMTTEYLVEMISAGVLTAGPEKVVPGWRTIVEPEAFLPAPCPTNFLH